MFFSSQRQPARTCTDTQAVQYFYKHFRKGRKGWGTKFAKVGGNHWNYSWLEELQKLVAALNDCDERALKFKGQKCEIMGTGDRKIPQLLISLQLDKCFFNAPVISIPVCNFLKMFWLYCIEVRKIIFFILSDLFRQAIPASFYL